MGQGISGISSEHLTKDQLLLLQKKFDRLCCSKTSAAGKGGHAAAPGQQTAKSAQISGLQQLPELSGNPMIPRLFQLLDTNGDGSLSFEEFVVGVELFAATTHSTLQDTKDDVLRLYRLAFMVYDLDGDGFIDAAELHSMLQQIIGSDGSHITEQQLDRVVQATMLQYDADGDWRLTLAEFKELMSTTDLLSKFTFTLC